MRPRELASYCREVAALVRAGVPIALTGDAQRFLAQQTVAFEHRVGGADRSRSLADQIVAEAAHWPPETRAVLESGVASGRLAESLESIARWAELQDDIVRRLRSAWIYPAILLVTASWLLGFVAERLASGVEAAYDTGVGTLPLWWSLYARLARSAWLWCHVPAFLIVTAAFVRWLRAPTRTLPLLFVLFPGFTGLRHDLRWGAWTDLLALLTSAGVRLPEALRMAGDATGDAATIAACDVAAGHVAQGRSFAESLQLAQRFPGTVQNVVRSAEQHGGLPAALWQLSDIFHQSARARIDRARGLLPLVMTIVLGGSIVAGYGFAVLLPVVTLIGDLFRQAMGPLP